VQVREVVAADPAAYAALWRFLLGIDLARTARASFLSVDEPLQHLVDEPRRLGLRVSDGLWIRIVDLPGALAARRYAADVDVVLEVTDPLLPANTGRWRLTGGPGGATCTPTTDPADLACTVLELGTVYLGATTPATLAAAGRVRELTAGSLSRASAAFGWHRLPNPTEVF
jgi:predicted acetyltransferase